MLSCKYLGWNQFRNVTACPSRLAGVDRTTDGIDRIGDGSVGMTGGVGRIADGINRATTGAAGGPLANTGRRAAVAE